MVSPYLVRGRGVPGARLIQPPTFADCVFQVFSSGGHQLGMTTSASSQSISGLAVIGSQPSTQLPGISGGILPWATTQVRLYSIANTGRNLAETMNTSGGWAQDKTFASVQPISPLSGAGAGVTTATAFLTYALVHSIVSQIPSFSLVTFGRPYSLKADSIIAFPERLPARRRRCWP